MASHGIRLVAAVLFLALCLAVSIPALASNPTVPQGGSASFASTGHDGPATGLLWDIVRSGVSYATSSHPNGWNVTYTWSAP